LAPIWKPRPFLAGVSAGSRSTGVRFPRRVGASIDGIQPYPHPFSAWIFDGEPDMRLATLVLIGALGVGAATGSAQAAPFAPASETGSTSPIIQVYRGCGWGFHPVPGHWSRWRGEW